VPLYLINDYLLSWDKLDIGNRVDVYIMGDEQNGYTDTANELISFEALG
jgi:hypothetical protein